MAGNLERNLNKIQEKISEELIANPTLDVPMVLAVSKKQSVEKIIKLYELGVKDFGENYLDEVSEKMEKLNSLKINWHYIGPLQSKKINKIVGKFSLIHTLCRLEELGKIDKKSEELSIKQSVLIQVNIADENTKQGVKLKEVTSFVESCMYRENVNVQGFMFFPPLSENEEESLKWFEKAQGLFQEYQAKYPDNFKILSMGTSQDYHLALRCGATLLRLGEVLMGSRSK